MGSVDVNQKDGYDSTPLDRACRSGYAAVVKLLMETESVDVNAMDDFGNTPPTWACRGGHEAVVKLLIEAKSNLHASDGCDKDQVPLILAYEAQNMNVYNLLIGTGKFKVDGKESRDLVRLRLHMKPCPP
jgi:ankyrin repeat protein